MAGKCDICGKIPQWGHNVSHSKRRTNRMFMPNILQKRMFVDGQVRRVNICTRCLRTQKKVAAAE